MENKRKRSVEDDDDCMHRQKILKVIESPYDADDEDSSSESESHAEHVMAADYCEPEVDEFPCGSGYTVLENLYYDNTLYYNALHYSENTPTVGDLYPESNVKERLAAVPIEKISPVINLITSSDDESSESGSAVRTLVSLLEEVENEYSNTTRVQYEYSPKTNYNSTLSPKIANSEDSATEGDLYPESNVKKRLAAVPIEKISPVINLITSSDDESSESGSAVRTLVSLLEEVENEYSNTTRVQYEYSPKTNYNSTLSPKIANSENSATVEDLYPKSNVKEHLAAVPIEKISPVINRITSSDDESSESGSAVRTLVSLLEEVENEYSNTTRVQYEYSPKTNYNSTLSPKIANSENSATISYCEPEVDEFPCGSGYTVLENSYYDNTLYYNALHYSENTPTVGDLYPKSNVKERLAAVPIEKISPVIDLTSTDDESIEESAVTTPVSLPEEADQIDEDKTTH